MPHIAPGNDTTPGTRPAAASIGRRTLGKTVFARLADQHPSDGRGGSDIASRCADFLPRNNLGVDIECIALVSGTPLGASRRAVQLC